MFTQTHQDIILPPTKNKMYHPSRYKTELCRHFEELGTCEHGIRCLYAHGTMELRPTTNKHPKFKTQLCQAFHKDGYCSFGPRCAFIHSKPNVESLLIDIQTKLITNYPNKVLVSNPVYFNHSQVHQQRNLAQQTTTDFIRMCLSCGSIFDKQDHLDQHKHLLNHY